MAEANPLQIKSLREQVYDYLRGEMNRGGLRPGAFIDLNELALRLGISRTPLRDAVLQLEVEGFVTILPRRGIRVNDLSIEDIRDLYEIVGALESAAVLAMAARLVPEDICRLRALNQEMAKAVASNDFDLYYQNNLAFHEVFLAQSDNQRLAQLVRILKQRLYDWPRRRGFVKAWEEHSIGEHAELVRLLESGDGAAAANHMRDVHWSFQVQERFVREYYFASRQAASEP